MIKVMNMKKSSINRNLTVFVLALMLMLFVPVNNIDSVYADGNSLVSSAEENTFSSTEAASVYLKKQMLSRNSSVTFTFKFPQAQSYEYSKNVSVETACRDTLGKLGKSVSTTILNNVLKHTGIANEGDYLINSMESYTCEYSCNAMRPSQVDASTGKFSVSVEEIVLTFSFNFYTTASQEKQFRTKAETVLSNLDLVNKTEYEKVQAIYSYIAKNVTYDYKNLNNKDYTLKQSAYAALVNQTAVCQGYSSLFYYLALSAGLDSRVVVGQSINAEGKVEDHAWNVVRIGNTYYYVDSTWDAGRQYYEYFLQGKNFGEHSNAYINDMGVEKTPESVVSLAASSYYSGVSKTAIDKADVKGKGYFKDSQLYVNVEVTLNGKKMLKGFDYKVQFETYNSSLGICSVKIIGLGLYESSIDKDIEIVRTNDDTSSFSNQDTIVVGVTSANGSVTDSSDNTNPKNKEKSQDKAKNGGSSESEESLIKVGKTFNSGRFTYKISKVGSSPLVVLVTAKKGIKSAVVPDTVKYQGKVFKVAGIGKNAFKGNKKLSKVIIGKNVKNIEGNAFAGCSKLKNITFKGSAVKKIGSKAFKGTNKDAKVTVPKKTFAKYKRMLLKGGLSKNATISKAK
jgi:hypothetical protein